MKSNNKKRLLALIGILRENTDMDHQLSLGQIAELLEEKEIKIADRKTLYDDFAILSDAGYEVEYDKGYYLEEAPFSLSEVKILSDSLNSLKNLDDHFLSGLNSKLYSFLSVYEADSLKKLEYHNRHTDSRFIHRMEDTLHAISEQHTLIIERNKKEEEEIIPLFLHRSNDYYYLYYCYPEKKKIYHTRFDNIRSMKLTDRSCDLDISKSEIIEHIEESTNSYFSGKPETIRFEIIHDSDYLRSRLRDDFSSVIFTRKGFSLKASVSDVFYAKLTSYKDDIKISDPKIAEDYIAFLNSIIIRNK